MRKTVIRDEKEIVNRIFLGHHANKNILFPPNGEWVNLEPGQRNPKALKLLGVDDALVVSFLKDQSKYFNIRRLEDGSFVATISLDFETVVYTDISSMGIFAYSWIFNEYSEAIEFGNGIKTFDEVPIKRNSLVGHRYEKMGRFARTDNFGFVKW